MGAGSFSSLYLSLDPSPFHLIIILFV